MRGKSIICIQLVLMLIISLAMVNLATAETTMVRVSPSETVSNPGETFILSIEVENAPAISAWEFKLKYDIGILAFPPPAVDEGGFLSNDGAYLVKMYQKNLQMFSSIQVGAAFRVPLYPEDIPPSGSGTLANITMEVTESGICDLILYDVILVDYYTGEHVPVETVSGSFRTTKPFVDFTWEPAAPIEDEVVTFDASASWDPDGGDIVSYVWEFGDGSGVWGPKETIVMHTYADYSPDPYQVTLTLTDSQGEVWSKTKDLLIWRDLSVVDIWFDTSWWLDTSVTEIARGANALILLTATNMGTQTESFDVTLTMTNDDTGEEAYVEAWWGNPIELGPMSGSGWALFAGYFYTGEPAGYYTMTAEAIGFAEEPDKSNNVLSKSIRLIEADLIADSVSITVDGDNMTLSGRAKNMESLATPTAGLHTWLRFEVRDSKTGDLVAVADTDAEFLTNEEETDILTASMEVGPGGYTVDAYAVYSTLSQREIEFYEQFAWPGALEGTSETTEDFTFILPEADLIMARPESRHVKSDVTFYGKAKNKEPITAPIAEIYVWVRFEIVTEEGIPLPPLDTNAELITNEEETGILTASIELEPGRYSVTAYAVYSSTLTGDVSGEWASTSRKTKSFTVVVV